MVFTLPLCHKARQEGEGCSLEWVHNIFVVDSLACSELLHTCTNVYSWQVLLVLYTYYCMHISTTEYIKNQHYCLYMGTLAANHDYIIAERLSARQQYGAKSQLEFVCMYYVCIQVNTSNYNVEYRDGTKSKGDKIGMPCTHSTVI